METGKTNSTKNDLIDKLQIGDELVNDYKIIAETVNKYFLAIAETIAVNNNFNTLLRYPTGALLSFSLQLVP
jgi:hypothetical protein